MSENVEEAKQKYPIIKEFLSYCEGAAIYTVFCWINIAIRQYMSTSLDT